LENFFTVNDITYQLVPPHYHRRNAAERAIRTFEEHFVTGLSSADPSFPMHLWDRLLPQAEITLNLLRKSRLHPRPSAAAHYHGLVDTMHHYRCQNVYISTTARKPIVDTLGFFPDNYQLPHLLSTDRLLMAANDMADALQNPHPAIPFASVGDDTTAAVTDLAAIFKLKLQQAPSHTTQYSPPKVISRSSLVSPPNQILNSPMPIRWQTRSQMTIQTPYIPDRPLPPRVVTPRTLHESPPRVATGSHRLSPRNLSQDDFCGMDSAQMAIALENNHWSQRNHANAVINPVTGKEMEYSDLMKYPCLQPLWTRGFGNECGRLFQGVQDILGTDICPFIDMKKHPK
jgi:hypothetical protein